MIPILASEDVETFEILTCGAVAMANDAGGICDFVLRALFSCRPSEAEDGPLHNHQRVGATYKQLAAIIGRAVGKKKDEYMKEYRMAKAVSLCQRHTHHILKKISRQAA
jgi:hypothetical protein